MNEYFYILFTIGLTVYGQLILKWRMNDFGELPVGVLEKLIFLGGLVVDPWIFSGFIAAFLASLAWMAAMTKFDLSYAYPLTSLNFVLVLLLSSWWLSEPLTIHKWIGVGLIALGTVIASRV